MLKQISISLILATVLSAGIVFGQDEAANRTVDAGDLGKIIGLKPLTSTPADARPFYMFHSIPYAEPTTGENRFKPSKLRSGPLSDDPEKPFQAYNPLNACPQGGIFGKANVVTDDGADGETNLLKLFKAMNWKFNMNPTPSEEPQEPIETAEEDEATCLVLNVNTPKIPRTTEDFENPMPVIFFIHGGSSTSVWGAPFNAFRLLSRDVVLVTINYRLGVLGAFNLQTDDAPGNAAMYDAITALQWVQKYIHHFGGDPNRVIVYGHSAGSMMASHLLLSPLANGLMHGVIGASGSALAVWGTAEHPSIDHHLKVAEYAKCYDPASGTPDKAAIVACMQNAPVDDLLSALSRYSDEEQRAGRLGFDAKVPSIQTDDITIDKFLPKAPLQILLDQESNNVPVIMGATRHDGSFAFEDIYDKFLVDYVDDEDFMRNQLLPALFETMRQEDKSGVFAHTIGLTYMNEAYYTGTFWDKLAGLIDITSVFGFKAPAYTLVELHSKVNPNSYYYAFDHQGFWSTYDMNAENEVPGGVAHIDDMMYPFQLFPLLGEGDIGVANRMIDYFVNFATYGDPNGENPTEIKFPPYNNMTHEFLVINKTDRIGHNCRDTWAGNAYEIAALDKLPTQPIGVNYP